MPPYQYEAMFAVTQTKLFTTLHMMAKGGWRLHTALVIGTDPVGTMTLIFERDTE